jgi:hypothetical protein
VRPKVSSLLPLFLAAYLWAAPNGSNGQKFSPRVRSFHFTYDVTVKDVPAGAKRVRVWIPVPQTDKHQTVRVLAVKARAKTVRGQEPASDAHSAFVDCDRGTRCTGYLGLFAAKSFGR